MNLSARNGWLDEAGRVYIIFTIEEIKESLGCAEKKAVKLLDELEKKAELIERKRQGLGKPNLIYVKNFISESVERQFLNCQNDNSATFQNTIQDLSKAQGNNTDIKNTDLSDTNSIFPSENCGKENGMRNINNIISISMSNWELNISNRIIPTMWTGWRISWSWLLKLYAVSDRLSVLVEMTARLKW